MSAFPNYFNEQSASEKGESCPVVAETYDSAEDGHGKVISNSGYLWVGKTFPIYPQ